MENRLNEQLGIVHLIRSIGLDHFVENEVENAAQNKRYHQIGMNDIHHFVERFQANEY